MSTPNHLEQISSRIKISDRGTVFVASDFSDLSDNVSIRKSLSRLEKAGLIRRVIRGVYEYPEYSEFLSENVAPSPHKVALALARNYSWTVVPNGDTALNQLGLSTQVPAKWTYVGDGPYKEYSFGNTVIHFNRTANKDISKLSYKSALLVQAIKAIGKDNVNEMQIEKLAKLMSDDEKSAILSEGQHMTAWVYEIVKKICNGVTST